MDIKEQLKEKFKLTDEDLVKPLPVPKKWSKPFWEAAKKHEFLLRKCKDCGHIDHPPYLYCTNCMSDNLEWFKASGRGTLFAFAINEYAVPYPFMPDLPYVVALIDLKEGPRMVSNIVKCDHKKLKNGMELEVVFEDASNEISLPKWRPLNK